MMNWQSVDDYPAKCSGLAKASAVTKRLKLRTKKANRYINVAIATAFTVAASSAVG
jgi:hypothetical protein